jgi:hypothetical protein
MNALQRFGDRDRAESVPPPSAFTLTSDPAAEPCLAGSQPGIPCRIRSAFFDGVMCEQVCGLDAGQRRKLSILCERHLAKLIHVWRLFTVCWQAGLIALSAQLLHWTEAMVLLTILPIVRTATNRNGICNSNQ